VEASSRLQVACPHCGEDFEVQVLVAASPLVKLHFDDAAQLARWLQASRFTIEEFERLPVYSWYEPELAPLVAELKAQ
jgi:hypothetical protein